MKDGIIKADGTSRLVRSVPDFKSRYPSYDVFAAAMAAGTLPLDILFNESGWSQLPDFLNKANFLKDSTAARYGLDADAVPDDVLALIQHTLNGKLEMKLLWQNASPASDFGQQTLSIDLHDYYAVFITAYVRTNNQRHSSPRFAVIGEKGQFCDIYNDNYNSLATRDFMTGKDGITFYGAYGGQAPRTAELIPYQIFGIKGVAA